MVWDLISLSYSMTWIVLGPQQYDILKTQRNTDTSDCTGLWRLWRVLRSHQLVQFHDAGCFGNSTTRCRTMGAIAPSSHKRASTGMLICPLVASVVYFLVTRKHVIQLCVISFMKVRIRFCYFWHFFVQRTWSLFCYAFPPGGVSASHIWWAVSHMCAKINHCHFSSGFLLFWPTNGQQPQILSIIARSCADNRLYQFVKWSKISLACPIPWLRF